MGIIANHTKARLAAGDIVLGMGLRQARTVDIANIAKTCGYDWLFIDMEHNSMGMETATQIAAAALGFGITPIVRVPGHQHFHSTRVLDSGAQGVVVPHVDTVAQAKEIVAFCKYPPVGHRSVAGALPQLRFEPTPIAELTRVVNDETLVVVMLETPQAIANADKIAAVQGIDVLLIGTNDLCAEMNLHGQFGHKKVEEAYRKVIRACRKHGKYPGMGGVYDPPLMEKYVAMGMQFLLSGSDLSFLMAGAKQRSAFLRGVKRA